MNNKTKIFLFLAFACLFLIGPCLVYNSRTHKPVPAAVVVDNSARDLAEIKGGAEARLRQGGFEIVGYMGFQILDGAPVVYYNVKFIDRPDMKLHQVYLKKAYNEIMIYDKGIKE